MIRRTSSITPTYAPGKWARYRNYTHMYAPEASRSAGSVGQCRAAFHLGEIIEAVPCGMRGVGVNYIQRNNL